jgi:hypothetical protein
MPASAGTARTQQAAATARWNHPAGAARGDPSSAVASGPSHAPPSNAAACPAVPPTTWGVARNQKIPDSPISARQPPVRCTAHPAAASRDQPASRSSAAATQDHPDRMAHTSMAAPAMAATRIAARTATCIPTPQSQYRRYSFSRWLSGVIRCRGADGAESAEAAGRGRRSGSLPDIPDGGGGWPDPLAGAGGPSQPAAPASSPLAATRSDSLGSAKPSRSAGGAAEVYTRTGRAEALAAALHVGTLIPGPPRGTARLTR